MDDAGGVGPGQAVRGLARDVERLGQRQRLSRHQRGEAAAVDHLHDDEGAVVLLADLVDGDDVGVVEGRGGAGLALEAGQAAGVRERGLGDELHRHLALERVVAGPPHLAHATGAQPGQELVGNSEPHANRGRHGARGPQCLGDDRA